MICGVVLFRYHDEIVGFIQGINPKSTKKSSYKSGSL